MWVGQTEGANNNLCLGGHGPRSSVLGWHEQRMRTCCYKIRASRKKKKKKSTAENKSFCCHIWTREVEQCSPETFCCICLNLTAAYFFFSFFFPPSSLPDSRCRARMTAPATAFGTLHRQIKFLSAASSEAHLVAGLTSHVRKCCARSHGRIAASVIFETEERRKLICP